jgi:hypothetical protein
VILKEQKTEQPLNLVNLFICVGVKTTEFGINQHGFE